MTDSDVRSFDEAVGSITTTLLKQAKQGESRAWERLVHIYGALVYRWGRQSGLNREDAADIGQEVFVAVAGNLVDFHRDRPGDTFRGWLRTITKNKIKDFWRRRNSAPTVVGGSDHQSNLGQIPFPERRDDFESQEEESKILYLRIVQSIRGEFSESDWQAFIKVVMDAQRPAEVAEDLGITRNQVYLAKSRIVRRIRDEFRDNGVQE